MAERGARRPHNIGCATVTVNAPRRPEKGGFGLQGEAWSVLGATGGREMPPERPETSETLAVSEA